MIGKIAVFLALAVAATLLFRTSAGGAPNNMFRLKVIGLLAVAAVMFAAKLFPVALMILVAAGGVTAIELWSDRHVKAASIMTPGAGPAAPPVRAAMTVIEAAAVLGIAADAGEDEVKAAHRKLIAQLHPDKGGTDYLAAQINEARRVMLGERG